MILSKAFVKSKNIATAAFPLPNSDNILSVISRTACSVE